MNVSQILPQIPFVKWGSHCRYEGQKIHLANTCSIFAGLQVIICIYNFNTIAKEFFDAISAKNEDFKSCIDSLKDNAIGEAKKIWILKFLKLPMENNMNLYGTDEENFFIQL